MWKQKIPLQINEDILSSSLQSNLYPAQAEVRNLICKVLHKFMGHLSEILKCTSNVHHMSKEMNFIWPSDTSL